MKYVTEVILMSDIFDFDIANLVGAGDGANSNPCIKFTDIVPKPNLSIMPSGFYVMDAPFSSFGGGLSGSAILSLFPTRQGYDIQRLKQGGFYAPVDGTIYRLDLPCKYEFNKPNIKYSNPTPSFDKDEYFEVVDEVTGETVRRRDNTNYNTWMQFYDLSHLGEVSFKIPHILFVSKEKKYGKKGDKYLVYVVGGSREVSYYESGKEFKQGQLVIPAGSMFSAVGNMIDSYYRFMSHAGGVITDVDPGAEMVNITKDNIESFIKPDFQDDIFTNEIYYQNSPSIPGVRVFPMVQMMKTSREHATDVFGNDVPPLTYYLGLSARGPLSSEPIGTSYAIGISRNPSFATIGLSNSEMSKYMNTSYIHEPTHPSELPHNEYVLSTVFGSYYQPEFGLMVAAMEFDEYITSPSMFLDYQDLNSVMGGNTVNSYSPTKFYNVSVPSRSGEIIIHNQIGDEYNMDWGTSKRFLFKTDSPGDLSNIPKTITIDGSEDYCSGYLNPATNRRAEGYLFNYMHMRVNFLIGQSMGKVKSTANSKVKLTSDTLIDGKTHYGYSGRSSNVSRGYMNDSKLEIGTPTAQGIHMNEDSIKRYVSPWKKTSPYLVIPRHNDFDGFHGDRSISSSIFGEYQNTGATLDMAFLDRFNLSESNDIKKKTRKKIYVDEIYSDPMGFVGVNLLNM